MRPRTIGEYRETRCPAGASFSERSLGKSMYYLALFSRNEMAFKFWDDVLKYSTDQTNLWD